MTREDFKEIIELPTYFDGKGSTKGFKFDQVYNINGWYIYQVRMPNTDKMHYEIFKETLQQHQVCENGKWTKVDNVGSVRYPSDECFGLWAWCCPTIESCMKHITTKETT
jgi:hypothetical protein